MPRPSASGSGSRRSGGSRSMQRDLSEPIDGPRHPTAWNWSDIRPTAPRTCCEARNDAFRDHWGSLPSTPERWGQFVDGPFLRPDLSTLALADGRVVAFCLASVNEEDWEALGAPNTYIDLIGVVRDHRGRRLAPAGHRPHTRGREGCRARAGRTRCRHREQHRSQPALRAARVPSDAAPASAGPPLLGKRVRLRIAAVVF